MFKLIVINIIIINLIFLCNSDKIPENILKCYSNKEYPSSNEMPPLNIQILIEILRKIESNEILSRDIRILTSMIYESVQFNGIELTRSLESSDNLIPYSNRGNSYIKYKFLKRFIPGKHQLSNDTLTKYDFCLLHKIVSKTFDIYLRGDESNTCPTRKTISASGSYETSSCPTEKGVLYTKWGTISPSNILNGIAAEYVKTVEKLSKIIELTDENDLNKTRFENYLNTDLNNVWISTIFADLAEVLLYQENKISIGNIAKWNDTIYPRTYYLTEYDWTMSVSEILGGLDGLILSSQIKKWTNVLSSTRLSQIIDMYYSNRGVSFDNSYKACNRKSKISDLFDGINLEEQIATTGLLLKNVATYSMILDEGIKEYAKYVAEAYVKKRDEIIEKIDNCKDDYDKRVNQLILTVVFDGSLDFYQSQRVIAYLTNMMDVSYYSSKLGIINGQNGKWIVNVTNSISEIFSNLTTYDNNEWPTRLSLTKSLETIKLYYDYMFNNLKNNTIRRPYAHTSVIFMKDPLSDSERENSINMLNNIKDTYPELNIIYITSDRDLLIPLYDNDVSLSYNYNDMNKFFNDNVEMNEKLRSIPRHLLSYSKNEFDDYVTPNLTNIYNINNKYIKYGNIQVKFSNHEYGTFNVCVYEYKKNYKMSCKYIELNEDVVYNPRDYCNDGNDCTIVFEVTSNSSLIKCSEPDCRYPDQVRISIHSTWATRSGSSTVLHTLLLFIVNMIFTFVMK